MDDAAGDVTAHLEGVLEGLDGQAGLHPGIDRVPHDPIGEGVFDRAGVELPFGGLVFGDVHEPELVHSVGGTHLPGAAVLIDNGAEIVMNGRAGLLPVPAPLLPERAPPAVR